MSSPLFLITGCPGSGKTTTAHALLRTFPLGIRISVDDLRDQVVSGMAHPIPNWTEEANQQFSLARKSAAEIAKIYLEAGFAVVIDDTIPPHKADALFQTLQAWNPIRVLLIPPVETCLQRNRDRTNKEFDLRVLGSAIEWMHPEILKDHAEVDNYIRIDNSMLTPEEAAAEILRSLI